MSFDPIFDQIYGNQQTPKATAAGVAPTSSRVNITNVSKGSTTPLQQQKPWLYKAYEGASNAFDTLVNRPQDVVVGAGKIFAPLGESLGDAAAAGFANKQQGGLDAGQQQLDEAFVQQYRSASPEQKEKIKQLFNQTVNQKRDILKEAVPSASKTAGQIYGEGATTALSALSGGMPSGISSGSGTLQAAAPGIFGVTSNAQKLLTAERALRVGYGTTRGAASALATGLQKGDTGKELKKDVATGAILGAAFSTAIEAADWGFGKLTNWLQQQPGKTMNQELRPPKGELSKDIKYHQPTFGDETIKYGYKGSLAEMQNQAETNMARVGSQLDDTLMPLGAKTTETGADLITGIRESTNIRGSKLYSEFLETNPQSVFVNGEKLQPQFAADRLRDIAGKVERVYGVGAGDAIRQIPTEGLTPAMLEDKAIQALQKIDPALQVIKKAEVIEPLQTLLNDPFTTEAEKSTIQKFIDQQVPNYLDIPQANALKQKLYSEIPARYWQVTTTGGDPMTTLAGDVRKSASLRLKELVEEKASQVSSELGQRIKDLNSEWGVAAEVHNLSSVRQAENILKKGPLQGGHILDYVSSLIRKTVGSTATRTQVAQALRAIAPTVDAAKTILQTPILFNTFMDEFGSKAVKSKK